MRLFFIRHGETYGNRNGVLQGQGEHPTFVLTPEGVAQVSEAAPTLAKLDPQIIFSSPLPRTKETTELILEHVDAPVIYDDLLKEVHFGKFEGVVAKDVYEALGLTEDEHRNLHRTVSYDYVPHGGESAEMVKERVKQFIRNLVNHSDIERAAVVAHGGLIRAVHSLAGSELESFGLIPNASIHAFDIDGEDIRGVQIDE